MLFVSVVFVCLCFVNAHMYICMRVIVVVLRFVLIVFVCVVLCCVVLYCFMVDVCVVNVFCAFGVLCLSLFSCFCCCVM